MRVEQIHELLNTTTLEVLGSEAVVQEDLSNIVDIGQEIIDTDNVDNYVKKLVNHIGKVIFVNRLYAGGVPSVLMDSWEYGSILEKISSDLPEAQENESWKLTHGESYDDDIFYQPKVSAKFFNSKVTFEIPMSFTERQVKESFSSANQLNGFLSMITTSIENAMTVKLDALIMRTINNMTAETLASDLMTDDETPELDLTQSTVTSVNLLKLYNEEQAEDLTVESAIRNPEFIKYVGYTLGLYKDRLSKISVLFNKGGKERFTPADQLHTILLSDFAQSAKVFLNSQTFNKEDVSLVQHETVPYWQGSGEDYSFEDTSSINVITSTGESVELSGIIGVMFDRNALGVSNLDRRVTTNYNAKAEFFTNFYKFDAGYFNDLNENFVVFFVA